jgi:hypothetical protein
VKRLLLVAALALTFSSSAAAFVDVSDSMQDPGGSNAPCYHFTHAGNVAYYYIGPGTLHIYWVCTGLGGGLVYWEFRGYVWL